MTDHSLRQLLEELHTKLESSTALSDEERKSLQKLAADIQSALGSPAGHATAAGILGRVETAATQLEGSHPELTVTLMRVVKALADMGI